MTFRNQNPSLDAFHATHDRLAIAALAAGDARGADAERATDLVQRCDACRILHDDLRSLAVATRTLPAAARPTDRDFRLSAADAVRLSRRGWLRRLLRPLGSARGARLQPAAGALVALGLAVVVLSGPSVLQLGSAGAAPIGAAPSVAATSEAAFGPAQATSNPDSASPGVKDLATGGLDTGGGAPGALQGSPRPSGGGAPGMLQGSPRPTDGGESREAPAPRESESVGGDRIPWPLIGLLLVATGTALLVVRRIALRIR